MKNILMCLLLPLVLAGCATNPYKMFYHDCIGMDVLKNPTVIVPSKDPKLYRGADKEQDITMMRENNYVLIGYSSFFGPTAPANEAIAYGKELHATIILLYSNYKDTLSDMMPLTLPTTQTSTTQGTGMVGNTSYSGSFNTTTYGTQTTYMPYSVTRYDYLASFWIEGKAPILGIIYNDLTPEAKKQIGSNKGVIIEGVVKNSPAFEADLVNGDIVKKFDEVEIVDANHFNRILHARAGQKVSLCFIRGGKETNKTIQLNSSPENSAK